MPKTNSSMMPSIDPATGRWKRSVPRTAEEDEFYKICSEIAGLRWDMLAVVFDPNTQDYDPNPDRKRYAYLKDKIKKLDARRDELRPFVRDLKKS